MKNSHENHLFEEKLLSTENDILSKPNEILNLEQINHTRNKLFNKNTEINSKINNMGDKEVEEIYNKYNELKIKINSFWNKIM